MCDLGTGGMWNEVGPNNDASVSSHFMLRKLSIGLVDRGWGGKAST
jgi:hypothetical protein